MKKQLSRNVVVSALRQSCLPCDRSRFGKYVVTAGCALRVRQ